MKIQSKLFPLLFLAALWSGTPLLGQGTAFTYQGRLIQSSAPATGLYDFQFTVRDASSGGSGVGVFPLTVTLPVTNGLFTVTLDPGAGVFTGPARWLDIAVRTNGVGGYTTLIPRQPITAAPYAVRAAGAAVASSVTPGAVTAAGLAPGAVYQVGSPSGSISNALQVSANGLIGIGTGTNVPQAGLEVASGNSIVAPRVLASFRDEVAGYTNLAVVTSVAVVENLLAVGSLNDKGITLIDISVPEAPVLSTQFRNGENGFNKIVGITSLAMKTNLLVAGGNETNVVTIIGVTNPAAPVKLAELEDGVGGWNELNGIIALVVRGNLLAIGSQFDNAVTLADISNPSAPIKLVEIKDGSFGFNNLLQVSSLAISGNLMAIGAFGDHAVTLVDITDPSNPIKRSELKDGVGGFTNLNSAYKVAFSTNGLLAISGAGDNAVTLVDVSNPASPVKRAELIEGVNGVNSLSVPTGVAFSGNWLAVGGSGEGAVTLFDVSIPSAPRTLAVMRDGVGGFDYLGFGLTLAFAGTNLVYPSYNDDAATLIGFSTASVGIVSQNRVGIGTTQPRAALDVVGDVIVEGATLFDINATRIELGVGTTASGTDAVAIGKDALATGTAATALGSSTKATGDYSMALGLNTKASGLYSFAAGNATEASGAYSVAMGGFSKASGDYSFAVGFLSEASGYGSFSLGSDTHATGNYGVALGYSTTATNQSLAVGSYARALHRGSFVWGDKALIDFASTADDQFLIRADGGVAINTNNPNGAALHVVGTVVATEFRGDGSGLGNLVTGENYLSVHDSTVQTVSVATSFQDITFDSHLVLSGWTHTLGSANFTALQTGTYLIQYTAQPETSVAGASTVSIRAARNSIEVSGSQVSIDLDTASQTTPVSRSFICSVAAGTTFKLQFTGTTINNRLAANNGSGTVRPSVSMTINRIR
jgi:hypothetical protein